jgi:CHAT domain-containing protein
MEPIATVLRKQGVQVEVYNGSKATETLFKVTTETVQGILHINTHGFYKPPSTGKSLLGNSGASEPLLNSGLALAGANQYWLTGSLQQGEEEDGLLTAYEIAQLNLSGLQLATLSACETALGQPTGEEGTLGLVRGLRIAGVPRVLASLWPVPAKATNELMLAFYRQWALQPNPAKALRQAQLALLAKGYPPFYWAGWVLVE